MRKGQIHAAVLVVAVALAACAATYKPPVTSAPPPTAQPLAATKAAIMKVSARVLVEQGFQISSVDEASGTISTAPKRVRVSPLEADCGTTMGIDYLKDKRTMTTAAFGLVIDESAISIRAEIAGQYLTGNVYQGVNMLCVSKGKLEAVLLENIGRALGLPQPALSPDVLVPTPAATPSTTPTPASVPGLSR